MALPILWILGGIAAIAFVASKSEPSKPAAPPGSGGGGSAAPPAAPPVAGCEGVKKLPPPTPGFGTGFDALPKTPEAGLDGKSYKDTIEWFKKLTQSDPALDVAGSVLRPKLISAMADSAVEWEKVLRCSGYNDAASEMAAKVKEIRAWT